MAAFIPKIRVTRARPPPVVSGNPLVTPVPPGPDPDPEPVPTPDPGPDPDPDPDPRSGPEPDPGPGGVVLATFGDAFSDGGDSGGSSSLETDSPVLVGPQLELELTRDAARWDFASWLPSSTSLHLYVQALFGEMNLLGERSDVELYTVGLRVGVPLWTPTDFAFGAYLSAGPGWMLTDLGDAIGFDGAAGLRADYRLVGNLFLVAGLEANAFVSDDFYGWGPALHFGFNLSW